VHTNLTAPLSIGASGPTTATPLPIQAPLVQQTGIFKMPTVTSTKRGPLAEPHEPHWVFFAFWTENAFRAENANPVQTDFA